MICLMWLRKDDRHVGDGGLLRRGRYFATVA
jgi:hypothetical protein